MKRRQQPENLRLRRVLPALTADDLERSLAWYRDVVGFFVSEEIRDGDRLQAVVLKAGSIEMILNQDDFAKGRNREKGIGFSLYCETGQDVDQLATGIRARGGQLLSEPEDKPWGSRDFSLLDPDGFKLTISSPLED